MHYVRIAVNKLREGLDPGRKITPARIKRLEYIGQWEIPDPKKAFEQRCRDLEEFKSEFGHCNIPYMYPSGFFVGKVV